MMKSIIKIKKKHAKLSIKMINKNKKSSELKKRKFAKLKFIFQIV